MLLGFQVPGVGVRKEFFDRLADGRDLVSDDADLAGCLPAADALLGGAPHGQVQRFADVFAGQGTLDPDGAVAAVPAASFSLVRAVSRVAAVGRERHGSSILPQVWDNMSTTKIAQSLTACD